MFSWPQPSESEPLPQQEHPHPFDHLLNQARQGDGEALGALYRQFLPGIFGYIAARMPERSLAEDLTSEVFLKMVEGIHKVRTNDEAGFAAWLLRIAQLTVDGYYRGREKQPLLVSLTPIRPTSEEDILATHYADDDPAQIAEIRDEWQSVVQAMNALTEEQRQVLVSRLLLGYDVATVARMLGKKENAVKALQFRALQSLQRLLHPTKPEKQKSRRARPTSRRTSKKQERYT